MRRQPLRWRKSKRLRIGAPRAFHLYQGDTLHAAVQETPSGWFSYGMSGCAFNTAHDPQPLEVAKKQALERVKKHIDYNEATP